MVYRRAALARKLPSPMRIAMKTVIALLTAGLLAAAQTPEPKPYTGTGPFSGLTGKYMPRNSAPVDFSNSNRLERLMRAGRIYLSLEDAIALALENNLDIEFARFNPRISDTDVDRASAGSLLRGLF
jgi:hypothetical protein